MGLRVHFTLQQCPIRGVGNFSKFIFHSTYYRTCSNPNAINIVTVHDFTYELYSKGIKKWVHSCTKRKALRKADFIIYISTLPIPANNSLYTYLWV